MLSEDEVDWEADTAVADVKVKYSAKMIGMQFGFIVPGKFMKVLP